MRGKNHGKHGTPIYWCWSNMVQRCTNPKNNNYHRYGARGIGVCERWLDFRSFYKDMGDRPKGLSIDRIENEGDYEPSNCKWSDKREQSINQRTRTDNKTGIKGVFFNTSRNKYMAYIKVHGKQIKLYYGHDFFEACCARMLAVNKYF